MRETPSRPPRQGLRPFIKTLWASDVSGSARGGGAERELVLPTGEMHLVFRLSDQPLQVYDGAEDTSGHTLGHALVGGVRASFYVKDISRPVRSVGAQLHPGASHLLFGAPAGELAGRHIPLEELWGSPAAAEAREKLVEAGNPARQIDLLESLLAARLPRVHALHPAVAHALARFTTGTSVGEVVQEAGWSHRWFITLFRRAMGLSPKAYLRLLRFQGAVRRAAFDQRSSWADIALDAGYSDQPHFNREFRRFAGVTPGEYRALSPAQSHHVPIRTGLRRPATEFNSLQDGRCRRS